MNNRTKFLRAIKNRKELILIENIPCAMHSNYKHIYKDMFFCYNKKRKFYEAHTYSTWTNNIDSIEFTFNSLDEFFYIMEYMSVHKKIQRNRLSESAEYAEQEEREREKLSQQYTSEVHEWMREKVFLHKGVL